MNRHVKLIALGLVVLAAATLGAVYKWTDEEGVTHYSDKPPAGGAAKELPIAPPPPAAETGGSAPSGPKEDQEKGTAPPESAPESPRTGRQPAPETRGDPSDTRAPLRTSELMTTTRTWIHYRMNGRILAGALGVSVRANSSLDSELWVRAEFEVPVMGTGDSGLIDHPAPPLQSLVLPEDPVEVRPGDEVTFETGALKHLRCRFYWVTVLVYEDRSGGNILGHHRQAIYSRLDGTRIRSDRELDEALASERHCAP